MARRYVDEYGNVTYNELDQKSYVGQTPRMRATAARTSAMTASALDPRVTALISTVNALQNEINDLKNRLMSDEGPFDMNLLASALNSASNYSDIKNEKLEREIIAILSDHEGAVFSYVWLQNTLAGMNNWNETQRQQLKNEIIAMFS